MPDICLLQFVLLVGYKADTYFTVPLRVEG